MLVGLVADKTHDCEQITCIISTICLSFGKVIQSALQKRGIELNWLTPNGAKINDAVDEAAADSSLVVGFIVNAPRQERTGVVDRILSFGRGNHWYAVTRISRIGGEQAFPVDQCWKIVDSRRVDVEKHSEATIQEHLAMVLHDGGSAFQARLKLDPK